MPHHRVDSNQSILYGIQSTFKINPPAKLQCEIKNPISCLSGMFCRGASRYIALYRPKERSIYRLTIICLTEVYMKFPNNFENYPRSRSQSITSFDLRSFPSRQTFPCFFLFLNNSYHILAIKITAYFISIFLGEDSLRLY